MTKDKLKILIIFLYNLLNFLIINLFIYFYCFYFLQQLIAKNIGFITVTEHLILIFLGIFLIFFELFFKGKKIIFPLKYFFIENYYGQKLNYFLSGNKY